MIIGWFGGWRRGWTLDADTGGGGGAPGTGDPPDKKGKPDDDDKRSFTQKELDALFAERGKQGASAREKELLEALGVKTVEEAQAALKKARDAEDAQKTELQKAQDTAAAASAAREKAEQEKKDALAKAQEKLLRAAIVAEATRAGFADPNDAWLYVDRAKIKAKDGADGADDEWDGVKEAVDAVAKAKPYLIGDARKPRGTPTASDRRSGGARSSGNPPPVPRIRL